MEESVIKDAHVLEGLREHIFKEAMTKDEIFSIIDKYIEQQRKFIDNDRNEMLKSVEAINERALQNEIDRLKSFIVAAQKIKARINYRFRKQKATRKKDNVNMIDDLTAYTKKVYEEYGVPIPKN